MKRITILTLLCAFFVLSTQAQMKVVDFKLLETDMTANTQGTIKRDQNGEKAALIKIQTPERGFTFDGGSLGIVDTEEHDGEIWLYVPRNSKKLTISHKDYGVLRDYYYGIPMEGARTYEMFIDIGVGRYVTITSQLANSSIYIDGAKCGTSPLNNRYLNYGRHIIRAVKDNYEGEQTVMITTEDERGIRLINIEQHDMSDHFGEVTVTVDKNADIYFDGEIVGTGSWSKLLREGNYTIETRKADCDAVTTSFTVVAKQKNEIRANAPTPHTGRLSIYTRPGNVKTTYNGDHFIDLSETVSVPVGTYQMEFSRRGYVTQNHEYLVKHNETTVDTVTLKSINYIKPNAFYFGAAFTASSLSGVSGILGTTYKNHDLQLSYTFGIVESSVTHWNDNEGFLLGSNKHKVNAFSVKYGYQIRLLNKMSLVPQLGYSLNSLSSTVVGSGNKYADGAKADLLSIGAKVIYVPFHHCYLFAAPEVDIVLKKDATYNQAAKKAGFSQGGFVLNLGVLVNF